MTCLKSISLPLLFAISAILLVPGNAKSQISHTAESMALGGGGTAYLTGFESLFVNPANLFIREKNYDFQFSFLQAGYHFNSLVPIRGNQHRFKRYLDLNAPYNAGLNQKISGASVREDLISRSFNENANSSEFQTQSEMVWFGLQWVRPHRSYALSARTRMASNYELSRGLFSAKPMERNDSFIFDQSFSQTYQVLHEISFGYAESFTYLNGLLPQLSEFIVGIAPKIVIPGGYLDVQYQNRYQMDTDGGFWDRETEYRQRSAGVLSDRAENFFFPQTNPDVSAANMRDLMRPGGIGFGIDAGITYLITFGDDLSVLRHEDDPTEKSLRLSISMTDLGVVYQNSNPFDFTIDRQESQTEQTDPVSDILFQGAPNEHYSFLSQFLDVTSFQSFTVSEQAIEVLLPASVQAGALFQYNRLKLMGDISYTIVESAFKPAGIMGFAGLEIRPFSFFPLRAGTRLAPDLPGYYSFGAGIDTNRFEIQGAFQLKSRRGGPTSEIIGASAVGLKLYF